MNTALRRQPLASITNAANSPHRLLNTSGSKRPRANVDVPQQENEHPQKRQAVEKGVTNIQSATPRRLQTLNTAEAKVFERGNGDAEPTALQKKLVAAREKTVSARGSKTAEQIAKEDSIRQWQKHYRKLFPSFSFYFDNVSEDTRARFVKYITGLGAKEEKFFSRNVTHVITTRPIPSDDQSTRDTASTSQQQAPPLDDQLRTINPSLLEKSSNNPLASRLQHVQSSVNLRRDGANQLDILVRSKQMGMKIWASEKLHRILVSILEDAEHQGHGSRTVIPPTRPKQPNLSQVLKNEKLQAASERDQAPVAKDMVPFRGPFIYVHDMDEKFRPTMLREYPRVSKRTDGEWPQFRSAGMGKCPFLEDHTMKRELEQERAKQRAQSEQQQQREAQQVVQAAGNPRIEGSVRRTSPRKALQVVSNPAATRPCPPVPAKVERQPSFPPMPEKRSIDMSRPSQLLLTREPAASGMQRSNLTSAIQSQMISSTAATGIKAGMSREVHELKRKVLERSQTGSLSIGSHPSSHRMADLAGALKSVRAPAPERAAKSRAQERLGGIPEEGDPNNGRRDDRTMRAPARKTGPSKKEEKPGYCENCRDKYADFEEHILSRKHRKFAINPENWTDLDALLAKLQAP